MTRWTELGGGAADESRGERYAERFADLAATGTDVHGEATFCASLIRPGARVLDAGCGTGRVAVRLADLGFECVGIDVDPSMLIQARRASASVAWIEHDLASLDTVEMGRSPLGRFDLVVAAGNVVPLVAAGTEATVVSQLAQCVRRGGYLVTGFGLDAAHLPIPEPTVTLADYDTWCTDAGLVSVSRYGTWASEEFAPAGGYAVSVHQRPAA